MPQQASAKLALESAANYLPDNFSNLDLAQSGQKIFIEFDWGTRQFHFFARDENNQVAEVKIMPEQSLLLNTESIPIELQPMLEIGDFQSCHLTEDLCIKFDRETDRPQGIDMREFAVPGITFSVL
jgi:hypothetical protein